MAASRARHARVAALALWAWAASGAAAPSAPPAARQQAAKAQIERMIERLQAVASRLQEARAERDVIKLNYIGAKMAAIEGLVRVALDAASQLDEALADYDAQAAAHAEQKLAIAGEKVQRLAAESATAVGESAVYAGATDIQFAYDAALAGPPSQRPELLLEALLQGESLALRPPAASPYQ